jgi:hypothetical protein
MRYLFILLIAILAPGPATAQASKAKEKEKEAPVPKAYLPPAGMCRIWVDNVPAARQPAPTDCATAIRNRPPNARVVFPATKDGRAGAPKTGAPGRPRPDTTRRKPPG